MGFTTIARQRGMGNTVASHGKRNSEHVPIKDCRAARTSINRDLSPPESQQKNNKGAGRTRARSHALGYKLATSDAGHNKTE
jgi:hypothetical protein